MQRKKLTQLSLILLLAASCLLYSYSGEKGDSKLSSLSFSRSVKPLCGARRALVMLVSHEDLNPSGVTFEKMQQLMDGVNEIFAVASRGTLDLEAVVVPEPVLLPGKCGDYDLSAVKDIYAAANGEVLRKYGSEMNSDTFDVLVYFFPTDTNTDPFGMTKWKSTFGLRYTPAVVNVGTATSTRPEGIAHELGHAYLQYAHAASADPEKGEVLRWAGDIYELMGYGLNLNLKNPPHLGMTYRYYWGWTDPEEITPVTEPGTFQLDAGQALLVPTNESNLLWLEIIKAEQAYEDETGGLLVRIDRAAKPGIYHSTLDMTPETKFQPDLHMNPGQSIVFEGRRITYVKSLDSGHSNTPSAMVKIEASGRWIISELR